MENVPKLRPQSDAANEDDVLNFQSLAFYAFFYVSCVRVKVFDQQSYLKVAFF